MTIRRCTFEGNNALGGAAGLGGAIASSNANTLIVNSTFEANMAQFGGAIFANGAGMLDVWNCALRLNTAAGGFGGAASRRGGLDSSARSASPTIRSSPGDIM